MLRSWCVCFAYVGTLAFLAIGGVLILPRRQQLMLCSGIRRADWMALPKLRPAGRVLSRRGCQGTGFHATFSSHSVLLWRGVAGMTL
jgi:hypothetical protein